MAGKRLSDRLLEQTHFSWLPRNCRMAVLYFLAEEPIQDREQRDCCLIVEVHVPDRVDDQWVQRRPKMRSKKNSAKL
jgi:hypothetical protein